MITSTSNPRVRQLVLWQEKAKKRREDNVFLAEGIKMLREAPRDWIKEVYLTEEVLQRLRKEDEEVLTKIENTAETQPHRLRKRLLRQILTGERGSSYHCHRL